MPKYTLPLLDEFLENIQSNNYSSETVYNYERDLNVFEIKYDDIFIYGSNHDAKLRRASINDKIHNFNDILSHLYYFDFSSNNHIETDIDILISKINRLVVKTNLTEQDSKEIIAVLQDKINNFEVDVKNN